MEIKLDYQPTKRSRSHRKLLWCVLRFIKSHFYYMYWLLGSCKKRKILPFSRLIIPVVIMSVLTVVISAGVRIVLSGEQRPWIVFLKVRQGMFLPKLWILGVIAVLSRREVVVFKLTAKGGNPFFVLVFKRLVLLLVLAVVWVSKACKNQKILM